MRMGKNPTTFGKKPHSIRVEDDRDPVIGSLQGREFCDLAHGFGLQKPKDPRCAPGCRRMALGKKRAGFPKQEFCFGNMTRISNAK